MDVTRVRALRGPNLWTRHTALELVVELPPEERSIDTMSRYEARLRARFPALGPIRPVSHRGDLPLACALEFALLRLQSEAGCAVTFSHTAPALEEGIYRVVVEYTQEAVGRLALEYALQLHQAALADTPFEVAGALSKLRELDRANVLSDYVSRRRAEVLSEARHVYVRGKSDSQTTHSQQKVNS